MGHMFFLYGGATTAFVFALSQVSGDKSMASVLVTGFTFLVSFQIQQLRKEIHEMRESTLSKVAKRMQDRQEEEINGVARASEKCRRDGRAL